MFLSPLLLASVRAIAPNADGIGIVVAGGPGTHSVYVPCFGNSRAVTRAFATA